MISWALKFFKKEKKMITKTIEYFAIYTSGDKNTLCEVGEFFDTFEEARKHINDLIEKGKNKGKYKYCQLGTNEQGCRITRFIVIPEKVCINLVDDWYYRNGMLISHYVWDKEHLYKGFWW